MRKEIPEERRASNRPFKREVVVERQPAHQREPVHPGEILADYMVADGWNQTTLSETLGVSRDCINKIVNGKRGISHETAIRLSIVFNNTKPNFWLALDNDRRLWEERQKNADEFKKIKERVKKIA
jgi:addiction module HigA family antidote